MEKQSVSNGAIVNGGKVEEGINITVNLSTSGDNSGVSFDKIMIDSLLTEASAMATCISALAGEIDSLKDEIIQLRNEIRRIHRVNN